MTDRRFRLAIDVGGTFTDVALIDDASGEVWFGKVLSTPDDPSRGSLVGAAEALERAGVAGDAVQGVVHATTVATNAVLEGKGAATGLITTAGFRDVLEMGRESRYDIYDLGIQSPPPLAPRRRRAEVRERIDADGDVLTPLAREDVEQAARRLVDTAGVRSIAICLLHGYAYPQHERAAAEIVAELFPDVAVSVSHQVSPEIREFERASTTVVDAYVKPLVQSYVGRLNDGMKALGVTPDVAMMLSNGGIGPAEAVARSYPVRMIESGPAAGAIGAAHYAKDALQRPDALAFDMGGTTAKISVIRDGAPSIAREFEVGHVHRFKRGSGYPLQISAIELIEIGAGGGSIAHVGSLGLLNVGPQSAGASPGPVAYDQGGDDPTVTDADLLLGYLNPKNFLGGSMALDVDAAAAAMRRRIAEPLGLTVEQAAWGVHTIVNERMAAATRAHAAERGVDLRRFAMIAFGGAGPAHAYALARKLGISSVICPFGAGVASAIGCLAAPPAVDLAAAYFAPLDTADWKAVSDSYGTMRAAGAAALTALIGAGGALVLERSVDVRCLGQGYAVGVRAGDDDAPLSAADIASGFREIYRDIYGYNPPNVPLEIVGLRARVVSASPDLRLSPATGVASGRPKGSRPVYFEAADGFLETPIYDREDLEFGPTTPGPAIIEERETSIVVGPDATFRLDPAANVVIDLGEASIGDV